MRPAKILTIAAFALAPAFEASAQTTQTQVRAWVETINSYEQPADSALTPKRQEYTEALRLYGEFLEERTSAENQTKLSETSTGYEGMQKQVEESSSFWDKEFERILRLQSIELKRGVRQPAAAAPAEPTKP